MEYSYYPETSVEREFRLSFFALRQGLVSVFRLADVVECRRGWYVLTQLGTKTCM